MYWPRQPLEVASPFGTGVRRTPLQVTSGSTSPQWVSAMVRQTTTLRSETPPRSWVHESDRVLCLEALLLAAPNSAAPARAGKSTATRRAASFRMEGLQRIRLFVGGPDGMTNRRQESTIPLGPDPRKRW